MFGPTTVREYAYWRGITMKRASAGVAGLEDDVVTVASGDDELLVLKDDLSSLLEVPPTPRSKWPVKLLYRFDPLLLGHKEKSWLIDMKHYDKVWIAAGHINGTVLVGGRIQGTWNYKRKGAGGGKRAGGGKDTRLDIEVRPFRKFGQRLMGTVEREAKGVAGFFGVEPGEVKWAN